MINPIFFYELIWMIFFVILVVGISERFPKAGSEKIKGRILFFDFAKGIAIISIIGIHATDLFPETLFLKETLWFGLYLFIIISGYLLSLRHEDGIDPKAYFKKTFFRVIALYLIFTITIRYMIYHDLQVKEILLDILFGRANGNYYFMPILIQFYLFFPLFIRLKKSLSAITISSILAISYFFQIWNYLLQDPGWNSNLYSLVFFGRFAFFFFIGMFFSKFRLEEIKHSHILLVLLAYAAGAAVFSSYAGTLYLTYLYPVMSFMVLLLLHNLFLKKKKSFLINDIGINSLLIYLIHTRIMYDYIRPISSGASNGWVGYFLTVAAVLILSYLVSKIISIAYGKLIKKFFDVSI